MIIISVLLSCDDELVTQTQIVVQFEKSTISVAENGDKLKVKIVLANAIHRSGILTVAFSQSDASKFTTVPALEQNQLKLTAQAGQSVVSFDIVPIDNASQDGNLSMELTLSSLSDHIIIGSTKKSVINIVDDEGPFSVVQFDVDNITISESTGNHPVRIVYSKPAPSNGFIRIHLQSNSMEFFTTSPGMVNSFVRIPFLAGQTESYFDIIPVNSQVLDGERKISLAIAEVSQGILFGDVSSLLVTIKDDENSLTTVNFLTAKSTIKENIAEHIIALSLSSRANADAMVEIDYQSELAQYGTHFTTEPLPINGKIVVPVLAGQDKTEFRVFAVNNPVINGDRSISFTISATSGSLRIGSEKNYRLWITDDELYGRPKSYETVAGAWRAKRVVEYNELGEISQLHWEKNSPGYSEGTILYHYNTEGRIIKLVENAVNEKVFTWEGDRIIKAERFTSGVVRQYTLYGYDQAGNIGEAAIFDIQSNGEFVQSFLFVYLYYTNGNIFKQLTYSPIENTGEYALVSTRSYETYHLDKGKPFAMVEILPNVNAQPNLPASYRVEENGYNILYNLSYEFDSEGKPTKRTASSSSASEVTYYEYY
jgi:hypothetical protein